MPASLYSARVRRDRGQRRRMEQGHGRATGARTSPGEKRLRVFVPPFPSTVRKARESSTQTPYTAENARDVRIYLQVQVTRRPGRQCLPQAPRNFVQMQLRKYIR